jgi:twitching motility protein PilT
MARIDSFLRLVVEQGASDLHFAAGHVPTIRHDGELVRLPYREITERESRRFLHEILTPEQRAQLEQRTELDLIYEIPGVGRYRTNVFIQCQGSSAVFRIIPSTVPTIKSLNLPKTVRKLTTMSNGLVLVTGPTGSGKTTSLAALIHEINATSARHIITIEDPIEFVHRPIKSVITQRQVKEHTESFASALRSALREAPDVLVIGELRDLETINLALTAAETGVLVFGTLHTATASAAINRIIDVVPEGIRTQVLGVLSVLMRGVIAQQLCRRAGGDGRVAVMELLMQSIAISNMIRENKVHMIEAYMQTVSFHETGMQSFDDCALRFIRERQITPEEGLRVARNPERIAAAVETMEGVEFEE